MKKEREEFLFDDVNVSILKIIEWAFKFVSWFVLTAGLCYVAGKEAMEPDVRKIAFGLAAICMMMLIIALFRVSHMVAMRIFWWFIQRESGVMTVIGGVIALAMTAAFVSIVWTYVPFSVIRYGTFGR